MSKDRSPDLGRALAQAIGSAFSASLVKSGKGSSKSDGQREEPSEKNSQERSSKHPLTTRQERITMYIRSRGVDHGSTHYRTDTHHGGSSDQV
jgi:hypothetical protein